MLERREPQPSITFTSSQQQALRGWNDILASINLSTSINDHLSPQQIADNRLAAFQLFKAQHGKDGGAALSALAGAFKTTRGHWVNGEPPAQSIPKIISHMNCSLLHSRLGFEHYRSVAAKIEARFAPIVRPRDKSAINTSCLVHPNRKAIAKGLCGSCYVKALRLNLLHLDMSHWLITLLKKRKPRDKGHCVNHAEVSAYADGLCVECLQRLGKLGEMLGMEVGLAN